MIVYRNGSRNSVELFDPSWYNAQEMQEYQDWIDQLANHQWNDNRNIFIVAVDPIEVDDYGIIKTTNVINKLDREEKFISVYSRRPDPNEEFNKLKKLIKYYKI